MDNRKKVLIISFLCIFVVISFLFYGLNNKNFDYFFSLRSKKVIAILMSSYCIGFSSVAFQTITNNRILTPSVIGLDSLYMFVQTFIVYFFGTKELSMLTGSFNYFLSIIFMIAFSTILFLVLFKNENKSIYFLILSGMIFGTLFNGLATFMQVLLDPNEFTILQGKMFASFTNVNEELILFNLIIIVLVFLLLYKENGVLDVLSLGRENSISLGLNYKSKVFKFFILISILISISTALTGPITFLGILVANLSNEIFKTYKHKFKIIGSVLISIFSLILGQFLVEKIFNFNTTISVIINFIGGLYFLYIILREAKI